MQFADAEWFAMVWATIAALHIEEGYPLIQQTAGPLFYRARELGQNADQLRAWLRTQPKPAPVPVPVPMPPAPVPGPQPPPTPPPISGGPMPDRSYLVRMMCEAHPEAFPYVFDPAHPEKPGVTDEENNAARLKLLRTVIVPQLNLADGGGWGLLKKTDQNDKIPCDILCWYPATEYADCMTGTGPNWQRHENPRPGKWIWVPA